jgi:NADH-quinone oxidoreductase subunit I
VEFVSAFFLAMRYFFKAKPRSTILRRDARCASAASMPAPLFQRRERCTPAASGCDLPGPGDHHRAGPRRNDGTRRTTRYDIDMVKCIYCGLCQRPPGRCHRRRSEPSSRPRREELYFDKERLHANGDRWEREIAKNIALDAPYR